MKSTDRFFLLFAVLMLGVTRVLFAGGEDRFHQLRPLRNCGGLRLRGADSRQMREVFVVAKNSSSPNLERILQLGPDLVLADPMFDESSREMLNKRGIPVLIESTSNPDTLPELVMKLGKVLGEEKRAEEVIRIVDETIEEVHDSVEKAQ